MKARLLIINPENITQPPMSPTLVLEDSGNVILYSSGWPAFVKAGTLADITTADIYRMPAIQSEDRVYLSPIRLLPTDDLHSTELLCWSQNWWSEFVAELNRPRAKVA